MTTKRMTAADYEKNDGSETRLQWNEAQRKLTHECPTAWTKPDTEVVEVIGR